MSTNSVTNRVTNSVTHLWTAPNASQLTITGPIMFKPRLCLHRSIILLTRPIWVQTNFFFRFSHVKRRCEAQEMCGKSLNGLFRGITTQSQLVWSFESQSWVKVRVVKWCRKKWNEHNLMYIYHKQCEICIQGIPSENWRPGLSENVVVFVAIIF